MNEREATKSRKGEDRRKKEREANYGKPTFISVTWNVRFREFSRSTFAIVSRLNTEPYVSDWSTIERYRRENIEFQRITSFLNCNSGEGTSAERSVCIVPPEARYARNLADDIDGERGGGDGCYLNYSIFSRDPCNGFFFRSSGTSISNQGGCSGCSTDTASFFSSTFILFSFSLSSFLPSFCFSLLFSIWCTFLLRQRWGNKCPIRSKSVHQTRVIFNFEILIFPLGQRHAWCTQGRTFYGRTFVRVYRIRNEAIESLEAHERDVARS